MLLIKAYLNECIKHFLALFRTIGNACILKLVPSGLWGSRYYWQPEAFLITYLCSFIIDSYLPLNRSMVHIYFFLTVYYNKNLLIWLTRETPNHVMPNLPWDSLPMAKIWILDIWNMFIMCWIDWDMNECHTILVQIGISCGLTTTPSKS